MHVLEKARLSLRMRRLTKETHDKVCLALKSEQLPLVIYALESAVAAMDAMTERMLANVDPALLAAETGRAIAVGDHVRHFVSGWEGEVKEIRPDDTGMNGSQGPLATVRLTSPRGRWKPITVTADELEVLDG